MASLVDVKTESGNAKTALEALTADPAATAAGAATATKPDTKAATPNPAKASNEDPRFAGKSREDVLEMYMNLESHNGRLANEFGQAKRTLDELMIDKRARDLNASTAKQVADTTVDPADLLTKPSEVLSRIVDQRAQELVSPLTKKVSELEAALLNNTFNAKHADATKVAGTPEFKAWANATPLRQQAAAAAAAGNLQAADLLLTEYKESRQSANSGAGTNLSAALEAANAASLESSNAADPAARPAGKQLRRADIMALRVRDPDAYERLGPQILAAYRDGRVVD